MNRNAQPTLAPLDEGLTTARRLQRSGWTWPAGLGFVTLLAWVAGTAVQLQQRQLFEGRFYLLMVFGTAVAGAGLVSFRAFRGPGLAARPIAVVLIASLVVAGLAFAVTGLRASVYANQSLQPQFQGRDLLVTGVVAAMVQRNDTGLRFRLQVESAHEAGGAKDASDVTDAKPPVQLPAQIYLSWYGGVAKNAEMGAEMQRQPAGLAPGERWQMTVRLKAPHGASNPHGFDFELWLWEQGLGATGYVRSTPRDDPPKRLAQTWAHPVEQVRQSTRDAIFDRVADRKLAGVIAALVVGDQNAIDRADWDIFRATGVAHLMSISGLHITMFAWLAVLLVGWLWRRSASLCRLFPAPSAGLVGGALLAAAYAVFSGFGLPAQRTVIMLATLGILNLLGKRWPWPHTWMLACAAVVLFDPWALLQAGFWLSFVAVGILFAADSGSPRPQNPTLMQRLISLLQEQWTLTLALTPLALLLFGQVSVIGLVANVLAIPWVTLMVTPLAMMGAVFNPFWDVAAMAVSLLARVLDGFASVGFATVTIAQAPLLFGVAGLLGGILLALRLPWYGRILGLPLLVPVLLWQAPRPTMGHFELLAADIGQGNAVLVRTQSHALVFDTGPRFSRESDAGHRVLVPLLRALDERVDTVLLSHRDADHTGGAQAVLAMQPQAKLLSSIEDGHELQKIRPSTRCVAGQQWRWDGVDFEILQPFAADYAQAVSSNALSCVLRINNGQQTALLTGDIELAQEARLVAVGANLKADVMLVPHHGSQTSSSAAFLDAVKPDFALVQAGYRNRFGHPAAGVMLRYAERQIKVFDSVHCGAATWNSAKPKHMECQREKGLRYWHKEPSG